MDQLLNQLNPEQQKAVMETNEPMIILAGAGSGKTRCITYKVLYLISQGIHPLNILCVTFTNKAAGEMRERIQNVLNSEGRATDFPTIGTFHALCAKLLRREGFHINLSRFFKIYDEQDQLQMVKEAFRLLSIASKEVRPRSVLSAISSSKNQMIDADTYRSFAHGTFAEVVAKVYPLYQNLLREHNALDFDDLLLEAVGLFKTNPSVLENYQDKFLYILVDEYQDTNLVQYELTRLLAQKNRNICIVGDFSQSIYSFRGADFRNLERFKRDFPEAKVFPLSQNYRSTQAILDAASSVISHNTLHPILSLWTKNAAGDDIRVIQAENEHNEVEWIIREISSPSTHYSDVAILYRTNAQSRVIEEVFLHHGIPYVLVGGVRFYERKEIKDLISLLSFLANQKDKVALKRIEKIGKRRCQKFLEYVKEFNQKNYLEQKLTLEILDEAVDYISYLDLYDKEDPEDRPRLENIKELRSVALEFSSLLQFLDNVALVEQESPSTPLRSSMPDRSIPEKPDAITLMTLHAAKGLEFKTVFMVGMEEGLFPHSQSLLDKQEIEEERRLCYVGMTRAKQKLFLSFAKKRLIYGQYITPTLSRFILELPERVLQKNLIELYGDEPDYL